jgi:NADPH:quinone reductase-like Zn-dependent oxidoreductase
VLTSGNSTDWPRDVREATDGEGADVAINVAGGKTLTATVSATKLSGLVRLVGFAVGPVAELDLFEAIRHGTAFFTATAGSREGFEALLVVPWRGCCRNCARCPLRTSALLHGCAWGTVFAVWLCDYARRLNCA